MSTTDRANGSPDSAPSTAVATAERATALLDFDGASLPPSEPRHLRYPVLATRVPAHLAVFARQRASDRGVQINGYLRDLIEADRDGGLPADCTSWLARQAAQMGMPGEVDAALVAVIRHLADRWPDGARLRP